MKRTERAPCRATAERRRRAELLATAFLLAGTFAGFAGANYRDEPPTEGPKHQAEPGAVEVRFTENSVLKLKLLDDKIAIVTAYGNLAVPVADVQHIDFATRLSEADQKRIPVLIAQLGSPDFAIRETTSAELLRLREKAYPALVQAVMSKDLEVARRANELIDRVRDEVPPEDLEVRPDDVILTKNMKITGRITGPTLKASTSQFGELTLKLADMRSLRAQGFSAEEETGADVQPAPQSLTTLQGHVGSTFRFKVTGRAAGGSLWGTDVYTLDSTLAMAAVHTGVLKPGQTGVVKVKIVPGPQTYQASTRHGVTSEAYDMYPIAFRILK